MNPIEQIILSVLQAHDGYALDNVQEREWLTKSIATTLLQASLTQLAHHLHDSLPGDLFDHFRDDLA